MTATYLQEHRVFGDAHTTEQDSVELLHILAALPPQHPSRRALRERVIEAWYPLAHHAAARFLGRGELFEDLLQTAMVGLIKAVDRFDPDRGVSFPGYAVPTIVGEIKRHFRDQTWDLRVPRRLQELRGAIRRADGTLPQKLGRSPTRADVAAFLDVSEEELIEGVESARAYHAVSLQAPAAPGTGDTELGDLIGREDDQIELTELRLALNPVVATLDERDKRILMLRFYGNLTQSQIGKRIGISQMHVSRLLARVLDRLRDELVLDDEGPQSTADAGPADSGRWPG